MRRIFIVLLALMAGILGCVISPRRTPTSGGGGGTATGKLYTSTAASILRFDGTLTATGNVTPGATITGNQTQLSRAQFIRNDPGSDQLFVPSGAAVLIFRSASTKSGNVAPDVVLSGSLTGLSTPGDVAVDTTRNLLYVADFGAIEVFSGVSGFLGSENTAPMHIITTAFAPNGIFVDTTNDRLFAVDSSGNAVDVFDSASQANDPVSPSRTITGVNTGLSQPASLAVDSQGRMAVTNAGNASITIYANAATANGNVSPVATIIGGNTSLSSPQQLAFNTSSANGDLYVADPGAGGVLIFAGTSTLSGNVMNAPARTISGSNTGLTLGGLQGIALDPTR